VGELVEIATARGRRCGRSSKLGICGEHAAIRPRVMFCHQVGLELRVVLAVPRAIARLAAAQAALGKEISSTA